MNFLHLVLGIVAGCRSQVSAPPTKFLIEFLKENSFLFDFCGCFDHKE